MRPLAAVLALTFLAGCTSKENVCATERSNVQLAKEARTKGDSPERQQQLDEAARSAREAGCDISDMVGPNVGA